MPIYYGSNRLKNVFVGNNEIGKVYQGSTLIYTSYREVDLGLISIYGTGDYMNNYYCNAHAILIYDSGLQKLKITGFWRMKGDNVASHVTLFPTNINVGAQNYSQTFTIYEFFRVTEPPAPNSGYYRLSEGRVDANGLLNLPLSHENEWHVFNQYDYAYQIITLSPA